MVYNIKETCNEIIDPIFKTYISEKNHHINKNSYDKHSPFFTVKSKYLFECLGKIKPKLVLPFLKKEGGGPNSLFIKRAARRI